MEELGGLRYRRLLHRCGLVCMRAPRRFNLLVGGSTNKYLAKSCHEQAV